MADVMRRPASTLDANVRRTFEKRLGHDFGRVRIHSDDGAAQAAEALSARAFTVGTHIVMGRDQLRLSERRGLRLLSHELIHAAQQAAFPHPDPTTLPMLEADHASESEARSAAGMGSITPLAAPAIQCDRTYTPAEIDAMRKGTVTGGAGDVALATRLGLAEGDLVFRLGSKVLASLIDNPVTHGGIYVGGGLIHDMVGFGNRTATLTTFYEESVDNTVVKVVRFTGPHSDLIVPRVVTNIRAHDLRLPTDPVPWNLFSSAGDYKTATCLEYSHAQYLYAIKQLSTDIAVDATTKVDIVNKYFATGATEPGRLATPQAVESSHRVGDLSQVGIMMAAADTGGTNLDPAVFKNRYEGTTTYRDYGPPKDSWRSWIFPPNVVATERFETFTYRSFADSRGFFTVIK